MSYKDNINSIKDYLNGNHPYEFGGFMTALLANDFVGIMGRADAINMHLLEDYAEFLYNEMPARTGDPIIDWWGSYEALRNRINEQKQSKDL